MAESKQHPLDTDRKESAYWLELKWLTLNSTSVHTGRAKYKPVYAVVGHLNNEERKTK